MKKKGKLIVLSGPSGIGKSSVRQKLINNNPNLWYSVSMTTRKPRLNEKTNKFEEDGIDYYFVTKEEFEDNIKKDNFFEYVEVYKGLFYGTPKSKVLEMLDKGYDVILEIDVDGALEVKSKYNDAILIFIKPADIKELEKRLKNRNTEDEEKIKERLDRSLYEISLSDQYDYVITSGSEEEDYEKVAKIIMEQK